MMHQKLARRRSSHVDVSEKHSSGLRYFDFSVIGQQSHQENVKVRASVAVRQSLQKTAPPQNTHILIPPHSPPLPHTLAPLGAHLRTASLPRPNSKQRQLPTGQPPPTRRPLVHSQLKKKSTSAVWSNQNGTVPRNGLPTSCMIMLRCPSTRAPTPISRTR